jgi:hypothetical protein
VAEAAETQPAAKGAGGSRVYTRGTGTVNQRSRVLLEGVQRMKKLFLLLAISLPLSALGPYAQQVATFKGEIMDSDCAMMGSHPDPDAKMCTLDCVKMGSKYVLFNAAGKTVYQLDDQKKPAGFAGKKVTVSGTLDKAKNTIHVTDIKAA